MKNTNISWCDHTFNPWIGCTKVSAGCAHCYAERLELRWAKDLWGPGKARQRTSHSNWRQPLVWDKEAAAAGVKRRVFCASRADVFDETVPDNWRFALIGDCQNLDWLTLTKRPAYSKQFLSQFVTESNLWLGVSIEDQRTAYERIPVLLDIPAQVRFLSVEPLICPIRISNESISVPSSRDRPAGIDWVIVGGESGPNSRPMDPDWARSIRQECTLYGWRFFMKQLGGHPNKRESLAEIPKDLRVREFPR